MKTPEPPVELVHTVEFLRRLRSDDLKLAQQMLLHQFGGVDPAARHRRIALIGLRGAGKSTLGAALAERLEMPFLELDRLIEQESGLTLDLIFDFRGQSWFPRAGTAVSGRCDSASPSLCYWQLAEVLYLSLAHLNDCYPVASRYGCGHRPKNTCNA